MTTSDERGMALAVAVFALVVIGMLVAGTFFVGRLEQQIGRNTLYAVQAAQAAEAGAAGTIARWDQLGLDNLARNRPTELSTISAGAGGGQVRWTPTVTRLNDELFLIQSVGVRTDGAGAVLARRRVGVIGRLDSGTAAPLTHRSWVQLH